MLFGNVVCISIVVDTLIDFHRSVDFVNEEEGREETNGSSHQKEEEDKDTSIREV